MKNSELALAAHNCIQTIVLPDRYTTFRRFTAQQMAVYGKDYLFNALSQCPSGVYLALKTNGTRLSFKISFERAAVYIPALSEMNKNDVKGALASLAHEMPGNRPMELKDTFDILIDDERLVSVKLKKGKVTASLGNPHPLDDVLALKVYLPVFPFTAVADFESDGDVWVDSDTAERKVCYCFGDSITQGFNAHNPSQTYTSIIGRRFEMETLNFGIGGYWFEADSLSGVQALPKPDMITIAYGTNDWNSLPSLELMREKTAAYLDAIEQLYSGIPTFVITPIWRADMDCQKAVGPFELMCKMVAEEASRHPDNVVIDGLAIPMHNRNLYGDGYLHPNAEGFRIMGAHICNAIQDFLAKP